MFPVTHEVHRATRGSVSHKMAAINMTEGGGVRGRGTGVWRAAVRAAFPTHRRGREERSYVWKPLPRPERLEKREAVARPRRSGREGSHSQSATKRRHGDLIRRGKKELAAKQTADLARGQ